MVEAADLYSLFDELELAIGASAYTKVIGVADKILKRAPGDIDALNCKLVALIQSNVILSLCPISQQSNTSLTAPNHASSPSYSLA